MITVASRSRKGPDVHQRNRRARGGQRLAAEPGPAVALVHVTSGVQERIEDRCWYIPPMRSLIHDVVPPTEEALTQGADGTHIHWSTQGRGEPALVLNDGIGCDGFAWKYV